jgi:hypothetical protein
MKVNTFSGISYANRMRIFPILARMHLDAMNENRCTLALVPIGNDRPSTPQGTLFSVTADEKKAVQSLWEDTTPSITRCNQE